MALRGTTVLIVEDESLVLFFVSSFLEDAGFNILEARNADEAITLLETHPEIAIIFTDIQMPGSMDGARLAHAVRERWPPICIIATSGHIRAPRLPEGANFFPK